MNPQESALHYPLGDELPPTGTARELAPGVRWIRLALPFTLDHINLWLLKDTLDGREGWTIVDCGIDRPETRQQWESIFANELEGLPVLRVIVTHMHPDHVGLAHWICDRWNDADHECRLWMSGTEFLLARVGCDRINGFGGEPLLHFLAAHGMTAPDKLQAMRERPPYFSSLVPALPRSFRRMTEGDCLEIGGRDWRCIGGRGHSPEHIALYCASLGVLIAGDMVLPRISTNVSVHEDEPEADPLRHFLASIDKYLPLPEQTLVLPSHGKPFTGMHQRIAQLKHHHAERLADILSACPAKGMTAHQVLPVLFKRQMDAHQTTFALGESLAHLHLLWFAGDMTRHSDSDGVYVFKPSAATLHP
jgi:glyoxylase-like metal-dependent hydrolase (beta-lactamase superfamily II)